jgi:hypothetical protein
MPQLLQMTGTMLGTKVVLSLVSLTVAVLLDFLQFATIVQYAGQRRKFP